MSSLLEIPTPVLGTTDTDVRSAQGDRDRFASQGLEKNIWMEAQDASLGKSDAMPAKHRVESGKRGLAALLRPAKKISAAAFVLCLLQTSTQAAPPNAIVPGTGVQLTQVGDDFEDEGWEYQPLNPKSSEDIDEQQRLPAGKSVNGRWYEGIKRGHPDVVKRVPTPEGGLEGSTGAMLMKSLQTGIPNRPSGTMHQDDFIANVQYRLGGPVSVAQTPSVTTRVFLPPIAEWEKRSGPQFAFRAAVETTIQETKTNFLFPVTRDKEEIYWPGMFICLESKHQTKKEHDYAYIRIRSDRRGIDFKGPAIETTGWWTLGMSFTPDGMVHYYAKPGIDELTQDDYITSQYPYGYRCERFRTFFYNVVNSDDGKTWSTSWIVDDPKMYVIQGQRAAQRPATTGTRR